MTEPSIPAQDQFKVHPILGILGVLLGAMLATFLGRLLNVGLVDLRGALHLDFDAASWMSTSYNMGLMFIGPFSVYLGGLLGARRVLLSCAAIFAVVCCLLSLSSDLPVFITLLVIAGLTGGTFYPLTLSFVLRNVSQKYLVFGIGAYAMDIVATTHVAHSYEAWLMETLSWKWMFWTEAGLALLMIFFVYFGIPRQPLPTSKPGQPKPSWHGFFYASLGASLLYGALDQGERLDWWRSSLFVAMAITGLFLVGASAVRHFSQPNPLINFRFLAQGNTLLLGLTLIFFRFALLSAVVVVPAFLTSAQGYTAEQIGPVLLWIAIPQILAVVIAVLLLSRMDSRLILAIGFGLIALACIQDAHLSSTWAGNSFLSTQLLLAVGEGFAFTGIVGTIILEIINSGSLTNPINVLTFAGFFQTVRLLGGEAGTSFIQFFLQDRERFHSNMLGLHVQNGALATTERVVPLAVGMLPSSSGADLAAERTFALLGLTVRGQAFTLAVADSFLVIAYAAIACLVVIACMRTVPLQFKQVATLMPQPTK